MPDSHPPSGTAPSDAQEDLRKNLARIAAALEKRNEQGDKEGDKESGDKKEGEGKEGGDKKEGEGGDEKKGGDGEDGKGKEKSHKPSKKVIVIGVIVVLLILAGVLFLWLNGRNKVSTDDAYTAGHVHAVSSRVTGTVESVDVDDNDLVKEGQTLIRLDQRDYLVNRDRAVATLAQAEAQAVQARAQVLQQQATVEQAVAQLNLAKINYDRNRGLYLRDEKAVAKADVDTTEGTFKAQESQVAAARANVKAAEANVKNADANVTAAHAQLADAELQLSYCRIAAPVDGRISRKSAESGQRVAVGQALLSVVPENVWIIANFKETQLERIVVGQRVDVEVDALPHKVFIATVDSIQEGTGATFALLPSDNATGNFTKIVQRVPVKIVFDENSIRDFKDKIVPGLSVIPKVDLLSAAPGKPAEAAGKRENKRQERREKQNREQEEEKK